MFKYNLIKYSTYTSLSIYFRYKIFFTIAGFLRISVCRSIIHVATHYYWKAQEMTNDSHKKTCFEYVYLIKNNISGSNIFLRLIFDPWKAPSDSQHLIGGMFLYIYKRKSVNKRNTCFVKSAQPLINMTAIRLTRTSCVGAGSHVIDPEFKVRNVFFYRLHMRYFAALI